MSAYADQNLAPGLTYLRLEFSRKGSHFCKWWV